MDVLGDDQVLQANLGQSPFEGIDNNDLDILQFEDFLNNVDVNSFLPEEAVGPAGGYPPGTSNPAYGGRGGSGQEMQNRGPLQHPSLQHTMVHTAAAAAPSIMQQQQQQQQQQQMGSSHVHKPHSYCHTQLPDSPPDSGSEPYSPPDGNQSEASSCNAKANMVSSMTALPQLYPNPMSAHSATSPQHSSHPQQHQQHQQHPHPALHGHPSPPHLPGHPMAKPPGTPYGPGAYAGGEPPKLNHPPQNPVQMPHTQIPPQMIASPYSSMNPAQNHNKKRKYSESPNNSVTPGLMNAMGQNISGLVNIKQEPECIGGPGMLGECDDDFTCDMPQDPSMFLDGAYQVIKWQPYQPTKYCELLDANMKELAPPSYRVDADKGFNFSIPDDAFVCQKKNHFQVTVHVGTSGDPRYVKTENGPRKIDNFCIHFKGVKMESTSQSIKVEQSQSDRSKKPFHPVRIDVITEQVSKITVGRLHFSETTSNNMRKKGKPNPDQRYFLLVVALHAHCGDDNFMVAAHASERIIVRASNPGQFDSDVEVLWQKGHTQDSVFHAGRVGINTDRPDEALTVHGNIKLTGHIMQPSDERVKKNIEEVDGKEQLKKVSQLKVYTYEYDDEFAEQVGLSDDERLDTGVLAQELLEILPDAVRETGDIVLPSGQKIENFLVVNKDRLYMENVGAVKELCKLTDNLEVRIDELEKMNIKLSKLKRLDSMKSTISLRSISSCSTLSLATFKKTSSSKDPESNKAPVQNGTAVQPGTPQKSKPHHHHHHHHRHGSPTKPEEGGICSNRFIQITITTLVLVMAFCLVSITTLYILEKQKSHNGLVSDIGQADNQTTEDNVPPDIVTTPSPFNWPNGDPSGPLMTDRCRRLPSTCSVLCCPPLEPLDDPGNYKPPKNVKPENPNENSSVDTNKTFVYQVPIDHYSSKDTAHKPAQSSPPNKPLDDYPSVSVLDGNNPKMELTLNRILANARARRSVDPETAPAVRLPLKASLQIMENNMTISSAFCENDACRAQLGGQYSYRMPVHQTFPIDYITLDFSVIEGLYVSLCSNDREQLCASTGMDTKVHQVPLETRNPAHFDWSLPVGHYYSSTYYFRVTTMEHSMDACQLSDQEISHLFAEYKLHFFRVCENGF